MEIETTPAWDLPGLMRGCKKWGWGDEGAARLGVCAQHAASNSLFAQQSSVKLLLALCFIPSRQSQVPAPHPALSLHSLGGVAVGKMPGE